MPHKGQIMSSSSEDLVLFFAGELKNPVHTPNSLQAKTAFKLLKCTRYVMIDKR